MTWSVDYAILRPTKWIQGIFFKFHIGHYRDTYFKPQGYDDHGRADAAYIFKDLCDGRFTSGPLLSVRDAFASLLLNA
jgi:hypothetical protein